MDYEATLETKRRYYLKHRDEILKKAADYRAAHPDYYKQYYSENRYFINMKRQLQYKDKIMSELENAK